MRNNTVTSVLVEFNGLYRYKYFSMVVFLQGMLVNGNIVMNTQWAYVISVGDLESSIFSLSTVDEVLIEDSIFLW